MSMRTLRPRRESVARPISTSQWPFEMPCNSHLQQLAHILLAHPLRHHPIVVAMHTAVFRLTVQSRSFLAAVSLKLAYVSCLKSRTPFEIGSPATSAKKTERNHDLRVQDTKQKTA
jgi:hypothetical protein